MQLETPKPYRLRIKGRDPIPLSEAKGELLNEWWMRSRPSEKLSLHDDNGDYIETILSSQIEGIERKRTKKTEADLNGKVGIPGFRCEWGEWHDMGVVQQENCGCWGKYNAHHSEVFDWVKQQYSMVKSIHTSKDFEPYMLQAFLSSKQYSANE